MKLYIGADKVITHIKINPRSCFLDLGMGILRQFYFSKVYEKLCDAYLKVGQFSKYAIGEMFIEELETGHFYYPDEVLI